MIDRKSNYEKCVKRSPFIHFNWIKTMKFTKWLLVPMMAFGLFTIGCGGSGDSTVVEAEIASEEEVAAADADYDSQYGESMEDYENDDVSP
jgi:hypothetical protein